MRMAQQFRVLLLVYAVVAVAGIIERVSGLSKANEAEEMYRDGDGEFAALMKEIHPVATTTRFIRGVQAAKFEGDLLMARRHFENAIDAGVKHHEDLFVYHIRVLLAQEAGAAEIETAVARWRQHFPRSSRSIGIPVYDYRGELTLDKAAKDALAGIDWIHDFRLEPAGAGILIELRLRRGSIRIDELRQALRKAGFVIDMSQVGTRPTD